MVPPHDPPSNRPQSSSYAGFRHRLRTAEMVLGTWTGTSDPMIVEAMASSTAEFLVIDGEHGALGRQGILTSLIAARAGGARTLVRLGGDDPVHMMAALDSGADGIIVPRVRSAAEVVRAVDQCRYPPQGSRGFGPRQAGGYHRHEERYLEEANRSVTLLVQIETAEAYADLDEILDVEGLDGVLVGRNDLALSMGLSRDHEDPQLLEVVEDVLSRARDRQMVRAIAAGIDPSAPAALRELGANVVAGGADLEFIVHGLDRYLEAAAEGLREARAAR
ncbi:MAG: hypothetical protein GX960_06730 [Actinomycetales bacterium]|nr:hypothetical protein [Actinomycetales bacterium]